jgi:murein DD-endopeptidase MepM/ murein hydrolase activator NlpD
MRTLLREKKSLTCRVAALALIAGLGSGCSSGFTRFDSSLYSSAAESAAQPGDYVDPAATGSIGRAPVPQGDLASGAAGSAAYAQHTSNTQAYAPVTSAPSSIQRNSLPSPIANAPAYNKAPLLAPASSASAIDPVRTASVPAADAAEKIIEQPRIAAAAKPAAAPAKAATASPAPARAEPQPVQAAAKPAATPEKGWTATGGTTIALREGETIYNLSKRYGVPVNAILAANNIKDAGSVQSGQQIVIPTYVYSRSAPISAPDNDPAQQAASSARGQASSQPVRTAAVDASDQPGERQDPRYEPRQQAKQPASDNNAPDYSVTTGSVGAAKAVTVAAGDSLNRIASRHGVTVDALKKANGLTSDNIRIGQVLSLPGAVAAATSTAKAAATDPIKTATAVPGAAAEGPKPYVKPQTVAAQTGAAQTETASTEPAAPARTGIEEFRWPVRGRVISNFGEKGANGRNDGIDISVPEGTAVKAAENGVVVYAGNELEGLGNLVLVRHSGGWVTAYAHNKEIDVQRGDEVRRGQTIARSGRTGNADMPKLHFELRKNSTPVDPLKYLGGA